MTSGLKMGVNVTAHTRYIFLGSALFPGLYTGIIMSDINSTHFIRQYSTNVTKIEHLACGYFDIRYLVHGTVIVAHACLPVWCYLPHHKTKLDHTFR